MQYKIFCPAESKERIFEELAKYQIAPKTISKLLPEWHEFESDKISEIEKAVKAIEPEIILEQIKSVQIPGNEKQSIDDKMYD